MNTEKYGWTEDLLNLIGNKADTEYEWLVRTQKDGWKENLLNLIEKEKEFNLLTRSEQLRKAYSISYWALMEIDIYNHDYLVKDITIVNYMHSAYSIRKGVITFTFENDISMNFDILDDETIIIEFFEILKDKDDNENVEKKRLKLETVKEKLKSKADVNEVIKNQKQKRFRDVLNKVKYLDERFEVKLKNNEVIIDEVACVIMMNNASEMLIRILIKRDINIELRNGWIYIS